MTNPIFYKRITGSSIQGDAYSVTEPSGTLVIANGGELRLHDGSTAGGNSIGGGGGGGSSGWQLTSSTAVVSLTSDGTLTIPGTIVGNSGALDLNYDGSVVLSGIPSVDAVIQTTNSNSSNTSTWTFGAGGALTLPQGSVIGETNNTTVITPPTANPGQSLVIRPTASFYLSASGYIVPGENLIITLTNSNNASVDNTYINYTITDAVASQLGLSSLTGHFPYLSPSATNPQSASIVLPIPLNSSALTFTLTIDSDQPAGSANVTITVTSNGIFNNELSHVHLVAGNPSVVDLYLGDDDQYVKIEKNQGNVVIGTTNFSGSPTLYSSWTFGTDGVITLSNGAKIGPIEFSNGNDFYSTGEDGYSELNWNNTNYTWVDNLGTTISSTGNAWKFGTDGSLTLPTGGEIKSAAGTGDVVIHANTGTQRTWTFGGDGSITFPDATVQTTAYTGTDTVTLNAVQTLTNKTLTSPTITDGVFQDTFSIGNQVFYEHGYNGFSVNENYDIVGEGNFTGYHYTSGAGRDGVAFTLARTGQFTTGFGIHGTAEANEYVIGSETTNTDFVFKNNIGMPFDVSGGTELLRISNTGSVTFSDGTVQTTAYRVMSLPPLTAWGTVVSFDNLSFSFDATTGSPGFNGGYGQGSGSYSTLIWTADLYQQLSSPTNLTISSGEPVQYFNYNGPNLITEVALTPGDSFVLRIQDVDTNRVYRATFLASFKAADVGNEGKYGAITVERLV